MRQLFKFCTAALVLMAAPGFPAMAQAPAPGAEPAPGPAAGSKPARAKPAAAPTVTGKWSGQLTQVGEDKTAVKIEVTISARGGETKYPDLQCAGKLNRVGASKSYVFFVEVITNGRGDQGGRCPDGTMTVARQGDGLALGWFGTFQDNLIVNYGTLSKAK